jgi:imidazolonepropionase-like amidohydrolase
MRTIVLAAVCSAMLTAGTEDTFVLRGVTVHPVTGPKMENVSLLVRNGRIADVGPRIASSKDVREVQAKGLHVYPGMINSASTVGLSEIGSVRETTDTTELGDFNPQLRASVAVNPASEHIPVTRANGITAVITSPQGGIISGQASLIRLDGWTWEEMEIRRSAGLELNFPVLQTRGEGFPPGPRIKYEEARKRHQAKLRELREFFEKARRYQRSKAEGGTYFKTDLKFEAMLPVLENTLPVVIRAAREREIKEALAFADQERIRVILAGVEEIGNLAEELKKRKIPVILGETFRLPAQMDDPYDEPYTLPARLHAAGVKFAFGTFDTQFARNLPFQVANAVAFGLPYEKALEAVTIGAAEIWGVAGEIGSIEKGKSADLILTNGDPLEASTQILQMFVRGRQVDLETKHTRLYEKYLRRP